MPRTIAPTACCSANCCSARCRMARVKHLDLSEALAMPGVKAILTQDDLPAPADSVTDLRQP